ncbi:MAG: hypothetical protein HUU49_03160 [Candidatus Buchananbacteria bacterium]|nr:hypothetical protein [Candidatus Buchananbacteria bacterium]
MIGQIILGLIVVAAGAAITIKADWIYQNIGGIPSAEKYLGTEGGSRLAYKLIGMAASIVGFLIMTNLIEGVLKGFANLIIPG